jgi:hypothetical protein
MALLHEINNGTERFSVASDGSVKVNNAFTFPTVVTTTANYVLTAQTDGSTAWAPEGSTGTVKGTGTATRVAFWSASDTISSNADLYWDNVNERLGIGTITPAHKLAIEGGADTVIQMSHGSGAVYNLALAAQYITSNAFEIVPSTVVGGSVFTTPVATFKSDGNVGIGTTSPDNILHIRNGDTTYASQVGADTMLFLETTNVSNALQFTSTNTGQQYIMFGDDDPNAGWISYDHSDNNLNFRVNATEKMRITSAGDVGIGTTTPDEKLDITGGYLKFNGGDYGIKGSASLTYNPVSDHYFQSSGSTKMTINSSGNVGIGTTTPSATTKLHIRNTTSNSYATLRLEGSNRGGILQMYQGAYPVSSIQTDQSGNTYFSTSGVFGSTTLSAKMAILTAGNVGIGTASPSYKLDVAGTIRATGDIIAYSDERVKENIKTIDNSLEKVSKLRGVEFNKIGDDVKSIGVIAQEVEKVVPEVVQEDDKGMKSVAYGNISGLLIEAIKELKAEIEELKQKPCNCNNCNCK